MYTTQVRGWVERTKAGHVNGLAGWLGWLGWLAGWQKKSTAGSATVWQCAGSRQPNVCRPPPSCALLLFSSRFTATDPRRVVCCMLILAACLKGSIEGEDEITCTPCERGSYAGPGAASCTPCTEIGEGFTTLRKFSFNESQCSCEWLCRALHTQLMPCCSVTTPVGTSLCMGYQPASFVSTD